MWAYKPVGGRSGFLTAWMLSRLVCCVAALRCCVRAEDLRVSASDQIGASPLGPCEASGETNVDYKTEASEAMHTSMGTF